MALTFIDSANDNVKSVKVRIIKDTVINTNGKTGTPIYTGSVLEVTQENAALLFASLKAVKARPDEEVIVHTKPNVAKSELAKK